MTPALLICEHRISNYMFWLDSHHALFYNSPPQMAISELTGHFPCDDQVFEAETAGEFEKLVSAEKRELPPSPSSLVGSLLHGPLPETLPRLLSEHQLAIVICGT